MHVLRQVEVIDLDPFIANSCQEWVWPLVHSLTYYYSLVLMLQLSFIFRIHCLLLVVFMSNCRYQHFISRDFDFSVVPGLCASVLDQDL